MSGEVSSNSLLKILCLHGCRQSKDVFRQKLGSLRKGLSKRAEMVFVESSHIIKTSTDDTDDSKSWWFTSEDRQYISKEPSDCDLGFNETIDKLEQFIQEEGPFDGILGFSQGATLAAIICTLIEKQKFKCSFKFAILVAGFKSRCSPHLDFYDSIVTIPSLHVIGDTDQVISKERSDDLMSVFKDPEVFRHPGGHYVPATKGASQRYLDFLSKFS